jgi:hypothetical protein
MRYVVTQRPYAGGKPCPLTQARLRFSPGRHCHFEKKSQQWPQDGGAFSAFLCFFLTSQKIR